jgi:hypothetical protein
MPVQCVAQGESDPLRDTSALKFADGWEPRHNGRAYRCPKGVGSQVSYQGLPFRSAHEGQRRIERLSIPAGKSLSRSQDLTPVSSQIQKSSSDRLPCLYSASSGKTGKASRNTTCRPFVSWSSGIRSSGRSVSTHPVNFRAFMTFQLPAT